MLRFLGAFKMSKNPQNSPLVSQYFLDWVNLYKKGAVREITLRKYLMTHHWLTQLVPTLTLAELNRPRYQALINQYAKTHEKQTVSDFHHQLKAAILDAIDEQFISDNPTRKIVIKGKTPSSKRPKFLNQTEITTLIQTLNLNNEINWDWFILLIIKTGLRFSEALAITPQDIDFHKNTISVNKTWDYKNAGGFLPTKNKSSIRTVAIDKIFSKQLKGLIKKCGQNSPIFVQNSVFNSTVNQHLIRLCKQANIPQITLHGLRHTHASLLLFAGVSIASVSKRLGHSTITTTQEIYLHIIQELHNQDTDKIVKFMGKL